MNTSKFIYISVNGYLGGFQFGDIINNAAMSILVHVFRCMYFPIWRGKSIPGVESMSNRVCVYSGVADIATQVSKVIVPVYTLTSSGRELSI